MLATAIHIRELTRPTQPHPSPGIFLHYVLRISHAGRRVLLTGDVEEEAWSNLVLTYGVSLKTDFMSASQTGFRLLPAGFEAYCPARHRLRWPKAAD